MDARICYLGVKLAVLLSTWLLNWLLLIFVVVVALRVGFYCNNNK